MRKNDPYRHLTDLVHHDGEVQRLEAQIDRLKQQRDVHAEKRGDAAKAVKPAFEGLKDNVAIEHHGKVFWLDDGILRYRDKLSWLDLVPDDAEPSPIRPASPPILMPYIQVERSAQTPVIIPAPDVKPMSYAERMAKLPYVPEPIDTDKRIDDARSRLRAESARMSPGPLTDAEIDEGSETVITPEMGTESARRMAFEAAMMAEGLPTAELGNIWADAARRVASDAELVALAEAWDRDEDDAIERLVGTVTIGGNGEVR